MLSLLWTHLFPVPPQPDCAEGRVKYYVVKGLQLFPTYFIVRLLFDDRDEVMDTQQ